MRQVFLLALTIALVFSLCACTDTGKAEKISEEFENAQRIVLTADIRADYGDKVFDFKITCTRTPDETSIEIKEPEEIAGIRAVCTEDGYEIEYDGAIMTTGAVTRNGLSPAEALPCLIDCWQDGYFIALLKETYGDTKTLVLDSRITDTVYQKTWFDAETLLPVKSEIMQSGKSVIICEFENVIVE
ncbi:MAG: hypothetical protein IJ017_00285 [Oscillospiraceae bacterium]|nr:hypothetical protein [Oscillospiraceae bacterium]